MMARITSQYLLFVVVSSLLLCVNSQGPPTFAVQGDAGQVVWTDTNGQQVASLKRDGSAVVLDAPLHTQELHAGDVLTANGSLSATHEMLMNLTERFEALVVANANLSAENDALRAALNELQQQAEDTALAFTWERNSDWFDVNATEGSRLVGYRGAFADEDFAYYVPSADQSSQHGRVVRINMSDFSLAGTQWFDLQTDVANALRGFAGGFAAGGYAYYVPFFHSGTRHGHVVRIDTSDFSNTGVEWFDLVTEVDSSLAGYRGGFAADGFAYYVPFSSSIGVWDGHVTRIDMSDFSASGVQWFNLKTDVDPGLVGFVGGFADVGFAYYVPLYDGTSEHGRVVRIDTSDFSASGVDWFDLETTVDSSLIGYRGGFAAGGFAYYVPYRTGAFHGRVVRIDTSVFSAAGVEWFDLETTVNAGLVGFDGGFADSDYAYYVPSSDNTAYHGRLVRIDQSDFSPSGVQWFDLSTAVNAGLVGFQGGFAAGGFAYYAPHEYDTAQHHGRVVRVKT